ncbi:inositol polyphosphate 1-phosphatase [Nasonia vitripennis]|uniref:inositol-1,4-bisphosphate 1-phosphatase n=1 Tax=Nasonia vitripennis TaxID=7425 RepID=A0A7M7TDD8_NASVI|nr:inositol polyphosphate 1-phosphatase [Nasonia vitripennis]XP_032455323.1 inositol polyphosphate 1-phosphatase [Nasonia vitripennis]
MKDGSRLLRVLLKVSEKAANIARVCRQDKALFALLVQEKSAEEKNPRFFQDFKTLADVLIQETIRHDIGLEFPELAGAVKGEENNVFSNTLGETITVEICSTEKQTSELLKKVLDDDETIADLLAKEVHKDILLTNVAISSKNIPTDFEVDISDLGIWIDPIDSTADYISGGEVVDEATGLHLSGLRCVTVLIGAYSQSSGLPVIGVVNQPFYTETDSRWKGMCYWGFSNDSVSCCSIRNNEEPTNRIVLTSRFEEPSIKSKLIDAQFRIIEPAGAGYKIISVALGQAAAYVLSKSSTYKWDVCGPHAILRSQGGGLLDFKKYRDNQDCCDSGMKYSNVDSEAANKGGLIAFREKEILDSLTNILC